MDVETKLLLKSTQVLLAARNLEVGGAVQRYIDSEVLRLSDPYLPFQSGALKQSGIHGTDIGSGEVRWNSPYARYLYYGKLMVGSNGSPWAKRGEKKHLTSTALNFHGAPQRRSFWFEHVISTLALDLMQPSDYTAELRKCQRYLQIYNVPLWFYAPQEWYAETIFDLQEEMRIIPSFSFEGNVEIMRDNGDLDILVSTVTQFSGNTTKPLLRLAIDNSKAVIGHSYLLRELKLIFSAEL